VFAKNQSIRRRGRVCVAHARVAAVGLRVAGWEGNSRATKKALPMHSAPEARTARAAIGTLNEGALHAQLKDWYRRPGDRVEQLVDGFVVDLVRGELLVEIQTGSFAPLRRKLEQLTRHHRLRLVAPVPLVRRIVRLGEEGEPLSVRRSPRRGRVEDIFNRLVSIPALLCQPQFELELLLTHQDELRVHRHGSAFRRRGWVIVGRRLVSVEKRVRLTCPDDAARLLPGNLPALFDTAQLADAAAIERRLAQQMTYCLRAMGVLHTAGKRGNAIVHRQAPTHGCALPKL
jgi:hypothetical protein